MLSQIGAVSVEMARDFTHEAPACISDSLEGVVADLWSSSLQPTLREAICGAVPGDYSRHLLRAWAKRYPAFRAEDGQSLPYTWFRARALYALYAADQTLFQRFNNPWYVIIMLLKLSNYTSVPTFALTYVMIDRRDEFQVVNFILTFKAYQFFSAGVYSAVALSVVLYECVLSEVADAAALAAAGIHPCAPLMPSVATSFPFVIAMEALRIGLIGAAVQLLRGGHTRGGASELRAIEEVRLDAADGALDGFADIGSLARAERLVRADTPYARQIMYVEASRARFRVAAGKGNLLPPLMMIDFTWLGIVCASGVLFAGTHGGWSEGSHLWLDTLFYMKMAYALMSFPFILFLVPILGEALHGALPTGYDMRGLLCPKLSAAQVKTKEALARRRAQTLSELEDKPLLAMWKRSDARRWTRLLFFSSNNSRLSDMV